MERNIKLALLTAMLGTSAFANEIQFTTSGSFCYVGPCITSNPTLEVGGGGEYVSVTAIGRTENVNSGATVPLITLGVFDIGTMQRPIIGAFDILIQQTSPSFEIDEFQGELSGNFAVGGNNAEISFSKPSLMIGNVLYTLQDQTVKIPTYGTPIFFENIFAQVIDIGGEAPEPSFFGLVGLGLVGIGWIAKKRKQ